MNKEPNSNPELADPFAASANDDPRQIPYRFTFVPSKPRPTATQTFALILTAPVSLYRSNPTPDHLCAAVARTIKALARPEAVGQIAQQLDAYIRAGSPAEEPLQQTDPRDPDVEITPAGTRLTQLHLVPRDEPRVGQTIQTDQPLGTLDCSVTPITHTEPIESQLPIEDLDPLKESPNA